jgi:chromosome segregation ATPase
MMMRVDVEVRARIAADEAEMRQLAQEIATLTERVQAGGADWREALERLAAAMERRRSLQEQLASLRWVMNAGAERLAG